MPQIKEYTSQVGVGNDFQTAQASPEAFSAAGRATAQAGATIGQAGNDIAGAVIKVQEMKEVTDASTKLAMYNAEQTNEMKRQSTEGNFDAEKFLADYKDGADKLSEGYSTRAANNYLQKSIGEYQAHFTEHAVATQAEQVRVEAAEKTKQKISANSSTLMVNPTAYPTMLADLNNTIADLPVNEKLKAKLRAEANKELAFGALRGQMTIDPEGTKASLLKGNWNGVLDTNEVKKMETEVNDTIRAKEVDAARKDRLVEKAKKAQEENTYNQVISAIMVDDPKITAESISKSNMSGELKKSAYNFMAVDNKKEATAAANERFADFADRARLPDGDPNKIYGISDLGKLSEKEFPLKLRLQLTKVIQQQDSPEGKQLKVAEDKFMQFAKDRIIGKDELGKMKDPYGAAKYAEFYGEYIRQRDVQRKAGIPVSELFKDPKESKNSMYNLVDHYTSSFNEKIQKNINILNKTSAPPRPVGSDGKTPLSASEILKNAAKKKGI